MPYIGPPAQSHKLVLKHKHDFVINTTLRGHLSFFSSFFYYYIFLFSGTIHPREDSSSLPWAEITGRHTQQHTTDVNKPLMIMDNT